MKSGGLKVTGGVRQAAKARFAALTMISDKAANKKVASHGSSNYRTDNSKAKFSSLTRTSGQMRATLFADRPKTASAGIAGDTRRVHALVADVSKPNPTEFDGALLAHVVVSNRWSDAEKVRAFEMLIEQGASIVSHPRFREVLDRDGNLKANQLIRAANGNIAYRSVEDADPLTMSDDEFWNRMDATPYKPLIDDNAAAAIVKMAEKFGIVDLKQS